MDRAALRAFAQRDYALLERLKEEHRARRHREQGASSTVEVVSALFEHACQVAPDFPSERYRDEDLEHHIRLKRLLERASHAFPVR
ncbi:MAG TPA: hypothetical protein VLS89_06580 [Candidatus Nanopelagicales bacterium]|nr:hypothetical protein [Candidatus Nanopelagicales bacterium]